MIVSFAWTTWALLALRKKRTRRYWTESYARRFLKGSTHQAYDRPARVHGHQVGIITLAHTPYLQPTSQMTEEDYDLEGLKYMEEVGLSIPSRVVDGKKLPAMHPRQFFEAWRKEDNTLFVVEFEFSPLERLI